jgi:hypothetical protein
MNHQNPNLYKALKEYVKAAILLLQKEAEHSASLASELPTTGFIFREAELEQLPEYKNCFSALQEDAAVFNQLDTMIGVGVSGSRSVPLETFMLHSPNLFGIYNEIFEFNELYFEREYREFEEAAYSNEIKYEVTVPLQGSKFKEPIKLGDNFEICQVNSIDLKSPITEYDESEIDEELYPFELEKIWAVRTNYKLPKIIGGSKGNLDEDTENEKICQSANEVIERVITALRIFCTVIYSYSNVFAAGNLHRSGFILYPQKKPFSVKYAPEFLFSTEYDKTFTEPFQNFWQMFQAETVVAQRKFIGVAARRVNLAHERYNWEDKIIDLLIAAEAIFFCDQNEKSELSYRLSLRASFFLATDKEIRKQIFSDFRTAYKLRSSIVHGSNAEKLISKIAESEEYGLQSFVLKIQSYICHAIYKAVLISNQNNAPRHLVDWDALVFEN